MIKFTACGVPLSAEFNKISVFTLAFIVKLWFSMEVKYKGTVQFLSEKYS